MVNSHVKSHPDYKSESDDLTDVDDRESEYNNDDGGPAPIDQKVLKKYISYAKACVRPVLHDVDSEKVSLTLFVLFCRAI